MANFKEIKVKNIENEEEIVDFSKQIGNYLYTQGRDVAVCEAGQKIYHGADVTLEGDAKELARSYANGLPYIYQQPLLAEIDK